MSDYDTQALEGAAEYFEQMATMGNPAPLAFAGAIRRTLNVSTHTDSDTLYHVGALIRIADASKRQDGTDIPLGEAIREACKHMEAQAQELGELNAKLAAMTPPAPWSDRQ